MTELADSQPQRARDDLGLALRWSALWTYLQGWLSALVQFGAGVVLARLLTPGDFGAFAAATAFTSLLLLQAQCGIPEALIRTRELTDETLDAAFWWMEALALIAVGVAVALAVLLQPLYDDQRFAPLLMAVGLTFLLMPVTATAGARLRHALQYRKLAALSVRLSILGPAVSIGAALLGAGVWSFVISAWAGGVFGALFFLKAVPWRPSKPRLDWDVLKWLLGYGWKLHLNNMLSLAAQRVDRVLLGSLAGSQMLGLYNRAAGTAQMPVAEVMGRLYQVLYSVLSRAQEQSAAYAGLMQQKVLCALSGIIFPSLLALWFAAEPFIVGLYGPAWEGAVAPLRWLVLGAFAATIAVALGALSDARGLAGRESVIQAAGLVLVVVAVVAGVRWGIEGVAAAMAARMWLMAGMQMALVHRRSACVTAPEIVRAVAPAAMAVIAGFAAGLATRSAAAAFGHGEWLPDTLASGGALVAYAVMWAVLMRAWSTHPGLAAVRMVGARVVGRALARVGGGD